MFSKIVVGKASQTSSTIMRLSSVSKLGRNYRFFCTAESAKVDEADQMKQDFDDISEEEKQKYRDAWGLKFNDECIKFEKEWEAIAEEKNREQITALKEELTEVQRRKVEFLADKMVRLDIFENRYLAAVVQDKIRKTSGINMMKLNMDWPSIKMDADGTWPPLNPNWFKQQELMAQLGPLMGGGGIGFGGGGAPAGGQGQEGEGEDAPKAEAKKEKSSFDIELTSFDAKGKIKIIKELRAALDLGLKEAKEMVEGAPVWIKKGMKKEDADELKAKLEPLGAELKIV